MTRPANIAYHNFMAYDDLTDCAGNIAYYVGVAGFPGNVVVNGVFQANGIESTPAAAQYGLGVFLAASQTNYGLFVQRNGQSAPAFGIDQVGHPFSLDNAAGLLPTPTAGSSIGTGGSPAVALVAGSNDFRGQVNVTTGHTGPSGTQLVIITFGTAYANAPKMIMVTPATSATAAVPLIPYASSIGTTSFAISCGGSPAIDTTYSFMYWVFG